MTSKIVERGDRIKIKYNCKLDDGRIVMSSSRSGPFEFTAGSDELFEKVSKGVVGLKLHESKKIKLTAKDAFGESNKKLIRAIDNSAIPPEVKEGEVVIVESGGTTEEWTVLKRDGKEAVIDANHQLAGFDISFELQVIEIKKSS